MKIGYVRVSTEEQNEARQVEALKAQGVEDEYIYTDKISGKNTERPQLQEMLSFCRRGDTVITESISRIARNTRDLLSIVDDLTQKKVEFVSLKEGIDTTTPHGRFMLTVFAAMAELERESILQRQREGIEIAKAEGKYKGRKPIDIDEKAFREICKKWRAGTITGVEAAKLAGLKKNTFYRRVKELDC
jgi:DNA invertase Pin-like site-specific DNA recombinase